MTRILITGANGFVGRHLIAHLLEVEPDAWIFAAVHHAPDRNASNRNASKQDHDQDFDTLVRKYEQKVYALCYRILGDREEATDLTQNTFIFAFHQFDSFQGKAGLTWLYKIASKLCIHRLRQRRPDIILPLEIREYSSGNPEEAKQSQTQQNEETDAAHQARIIAEAWAAHNVEPTHETLTSTDAAGRFGTPVEGVENAPLDITDAKATATLVKRLRPQQVYHLAARASGAETDRDAVFAVNVEGTRNLLEAAANLSPFPRVLLVSTGYVYGNTNPERPAREEDPIGPLWRFGAYTDSKIEMESVAKGYRAFALVARAFSHTGPGQMPTYALPAFARQIARIERGLESQTIHVGNLEAKRDLLDVRDVVRAYRALMHQGESGQVYNVATRQPHTMRDLLDKLRALSATPTEVEIDPARLRPADIACSTGDTLKLWGLTGWKPHIPLETTLQDTLNYWRESQQDSGA